MHAKRPSSGACVRLQGACEDGLPVCLAPCWQSCYIDHAPPLDGTQCSCLAGCLAASQSQFGIHPCSAAGGGITQTEANEWTTAGCPAGPWYDCSGIDPDLPCHVMQLIDQLRDAASLADIDR